MPNLALPGQSTRVFKNTSIKNNLANFGAKARRSRACRRAPGSVVNSNPKVEIFDNDIADNKTANLIHLSYYSTSYYNTRGVDPKYDPYHAPSLSTEQSIQGRRRLAGRLGVEDPEDSDVWRQRPFRTFYGTVMWMQKIR